MNNSSVQLTAHEQRLMHVSVCIINWKVGLPGVFNTGFSEDNFKWMLNILKSIKHVKKIRYNTSVLVCHQFSVIKSNKIFLEQEPICKLNFLQRSQVAKNHLAFCKIQVKPWWVEALISEARWILPDNQEHPHHASTHSFHLKPHLELFSHCKSGVYFIRSIRSKPTVQIITHQESCKEPKVNRAHLPRS